MTTLGEFQARIHAWAVGKGWAQPELNDPRAEPSEVEVKLARIALAHRELDELAEQVRVDPSTDISHLPRAREELDGTPEEGGDCNRVKVLAKLALIHTEVTEAVDAVLGSGKKPWLNHIRKNGNGVSKPEGLGSELADIKIRCDQLAGDLAIDSEADCLLKMEYNDGRPTKHGKHA